MAAVFCASFRRCAITRRKRDIGTRSSRGLSALGAAGAGAFGAGTGLLTAGGVD